MNTKRFRRFIGDYYHKHGRDLPWRSPPLKLRKDKSLDPYRIFVSEAMLQQTQVSRVLEKYPKFIKAFPSFNVLARAPLRDVLRVWRGMGYNRRALYLKRAAEIIVRDYGGKIPNDPAVLAKLPGIGKNTAGAIAAFAFNRPTVFIETNIRRVFMHCFFKGESFESRVGVGARDTGVGLGTGDKGLDKKAFLRAGKDAREAKDSPIPLGRQISDAEIFPLIARTLDRKNPREWYWALMDYGAALSKLVQNPNRRSAHYTKQSEFEGSQRQLRGTIIQVLLRKPATLSEMAKHIDGISAPRARKCIQTLIRDGLVKKRNGKYHIG